MQELNMNYFCPNISALTSVSAGSAAWCSKQLKNKQLHSTICRAENTS